MAGEPEHDARQRAAEPLRPPPPLPARWLDPRPLVLAGIGLWFVAFCVLLIARLGFGAAPGIWLWTCLAGWVLGLIGYAIMRWQQAAAGRGSTSAQRF